MSFVEIKKVFAVVEVPNEVCSECLPFNQVFVLVNVQVLGSDSFPYESQVLFHQLGEEASADRVPQMAFNLTC